MSKTIQLALIAALAALLAPSTADACSCGSSCFQHFLPVSTDGAVPELPANGSIVWRPGRGTDQTVDPATEFSLSRVEATALVPVDSTATPLEDSTYLVRPVDGWTEGERYRLEVNAPDSNADLCVPGPTTAVHHVVVGPPLTGSASIRVEQPRQQRLSISNASCDFEVDAMAAWVFLDIVDADVQRYGSSIWFETLVDGARWRAKNDACQDVPPGATWVGRMQDLVYAACPHGEQRGLEDGEHEITVKLSLPGSDWGVTTEPGALAIACPEPEPEPDDGAEDRGTDEGRMGDMAGEQPPPDDEELEGDAGTDGDETGGGCSVARAASPLGSGIWMICLVAVGAALRRRER